MRKSVEVHEYDYTKPRLYSAANPFRVDVGFDCGDEPSKTRQEFVAECDINAIMARYEKTGTVPYHGQMPQYLDLTIEPDGLMDAMNTVLLAEDAFMSLNASVRKEFDNDPLKFVEFAVDPANIGKMREWKLAPPEPVAEPPTRVEVVNAPPIVPAPKADA